MRLLKVVCWNFEATNVFAMASLQTIKSFVDRYGFGGLVQHYAMVRVSKEWSKLCEGRNYVFAKSGGLEWLLYSSYREGKSRCSMGDKILGLLMVRKK